MNSAKDYTSKFRNYIDKAKENNKFLVLAGCVPQGAPKSSYIQAINFKQLISNLL